MSNTNGNGSNGNHGNGNTTNGGGNVTSLGNGLGNAAHGAGHGASTLPRFDVAQGWDSYVCGFLRSRGVRDWITVALVQRRVETWFDRYPPHEASDAFEYADAVIDCFRLAPNVPIEVPMAMIVRGLAPHVTAT